MNFAGLPHAQIFSQNFETRSHEHSYAISSTVHRRLNAPRHWMCNFFISWRDRSTPERWPSDL